MADDDFPKLELSDDEPAPSPSPRDEEVVIPEVVDDPPRRPKKRVAAVAEPPTAKRPPSEVRSEGNADGAQSNAILFGVVFLGVFGGCILAVVAYLNLFGNSSNSPPSNAIAQQSAPTTEAPRPTVATPPPEAEPDPEPIPKPPPTKLVQPPPPAVDQLTTLVMELRSGDKSKVSHAAGALGRHPVVDSRRPEVAEALLSVAGRSDLIPGGYLTPALTTWLTKEDVPALIQIVKGNGSHEAAIVALGNLKDARASQALVGALEKEEDRWHARAALIKIGPGCESAVQSLVLKRDPKLRCEMCEILNKVGTVSSLGTLLVAAKDSDFFVRVAAEGAIKAIKQR